MKTRFLGGISFLPLFAAEGAAGGGGGDGKQAELALDPAEVAANQDPDWEANDPGDIGTVAVEGDGDPEPDTGKKADPEPEPEPVKADAEPEKGAEGGDDDGEPKTEAELKAAYEASRKAVKALSKRVGALSGEKRQLSEKLQAAIKAVPDPAPAAPEGDGEQPQRSDFKTKAEFDAAVEAAAERVAAQRLAAQQFNAKCNEVEDKGSKTFGAKWQQAKAQLAVLDDEGRIPLDILTTALETDDPAKVLFELGSDIEKATEFMAMTPLRRAIAMAKIAESKTPERPRSKTPPPVDPIGGRGGGDDRPRDSDSDEEWNRKEEIRERALAKARRERGY